MVVALIVMGGVAMADGLPANIAKPLEAAERDLSAHRYDAALKQVAVADAVPGKSAQAVLTIAELRAAIDATRGDAAAAASDYAALIATGQLEGAQLTQVAEAEASFDYQAKNFAGAIAVIKTYLRGDARFEPVLLQSYYQLGECGPLTGAVMTRPAPAEADLQMVAVCDSNAKDMDGYTAAMRALVADYPSPTYWADLLGQLQAQPVFADRLALDFFRLKIAAGVPAAEADYMEMTQEALQEGLPNEAAKIMAAGQAAGVLGVGADVDRQKRLAALVAKRQAAPDGLAQAQATHDEPTIFAIGLNDVDGGNAAAGIPLMEGAIRSGALTQVGQAELEMGMAYAEAGRKADAVAMWKNVQGGDGAAALAGLWVDVR